MPNQSRRRFVGNAAKAAAAGLAISSTTNITDMRKKPNFIHHVYFWLKNEGSTDDKKKLIEGLQTLTNVKSIQWAHIGQPADTNRDVIDRSYAVSWLLFFKSGADQASYQTDPIHLDFVKNYSHLWSKVIVYDTVQA